jgi:hypothetical protein
VEIGKIVGRSDNVAVRTRNARLPSNKLHDARPGKLLGGEVGQGTRRDRTEKHPSEEDRELITSYKRRNFMEQ